MGRSRHKKELRKKRSSRDIAKERTLSEVLYKIKLEAEAKERALVSDFCGFDYTRARKR